MDIYAQNILDRYKKPFYKGIKIDAQIKGTKANHSCGDSINIEIKMDNKKVTAYSFDGAGCAISMAAADMIGDVIYGMTKSEILKLTKEDVYKMLGIEISIRRSKCALLALIAIQNAFLMLDKKS